MSRAKYNEAVSAALAERRLRLDAEEALAGKTARETAADRLTADTITRLSDEAAALRGIVAALVLGFEGSGRYEDATALRRQLLDAGLDLTTEIGNRTPGARPARRQYTPAEAALHGDLRRTREALGAMEATCLRLQQVNEAQDVMLREAADQALATGRAA
ncbi:hypothetical protein [Streptomyces flaveolus]|uniref:hypothetical protein n=1 Tax=Streptomyces flaveolus TaxID=67297 RepID=UPI00166FED02|nr:hypothetical protein [Streptomyces flaveolus]